MLSCRGCFAPLHKTFLDLGISPIANNLLEEQDLNYAEQYFPLKTLICSECLLVQLPSTMNREELFTEDYVYHSSYSNSWLLHCKKYANDMISELNLGKEDLVLEIASNDGYLLQYFRENGINVLGIEPTKVVAEKAQEKKIDTVIEFFGKTLAESLAKEIKPRLIIGNNVLAHVPDLHDFLAGVSMLLDNSAIATFEFPHLLNLINGNQFDTIYHEHYSYINIQSLIPILQKYDLRIFDIKKLSTHGGSLRIYVARFKSKYPETEAVQETLEDEKMLNLNDDQVISDFQNRVKQIKLKFVENITQFNIMEKKIVAYGAAAKGNTLLNYCGINKDFIEYVIDNNPYKQGKYLPGSRIPIQSEDYLKNNVPDIFLILPWNLADEISRRLKILNLGHILKVSAIPTFGNC